MSVRIKRGSSRLAFAKLVVIDGIEFWTRPEIPRLTPGADDIQYTPIDGQRIDSIAKLVYQQDALWWVIAHRNDIKIIPNEISNERPLMITPASKVRRQLF